MALQRKFNIVLGIVFLCGLLVASATSYIIERNQAQENVIQNANLILEMAMAVRGYTGEEIRPLHDLETTPTFIPQTVPSYAAHQVFRQFNTVFPEYKYREAVLNPTNLQNRAAAWEVEVIQKFRDQPERASITGRRDTEAGSVLYLAHPIQITSEACLECHGKPAQAPQSLVARYGTSNGFGWQMNEIVGAQIVAVPFELAEFQARGSVFILLVSLFSVFVLISVTVNFMLRRLILVPLSRLSRVAELVSVGKLSPNGFSAAGQGEIGTLEKAIIRLGISLEKAMCRLDRHAGNRP